MRPNKIVKWVARLLFGLYALYVIGTAIFLNTKLFRNIAGMDNDDQTYVSLRGAISPFPGLLYVNLAHVFISDQNVSIDITAREAWAKFSVRPFLKKEAIIDELNISNAQLNIGLKTEEESTAYQKKYVKSEDLDLKFRAEKVKEFEKSHLTLIFPKIKIANVSEIKSGLGDFKGRIELNGGFMIQPKVHVEVYPTVLKFYEGQIPEQFSSVEGEVRAQIHQFRMIDAPGNAVFPYFDADMRLDVGLRALKLLNLTLRKLPGYAFQGADTRLSVQLAMKKGLLQTGSTIGATPTQLTIETPGLHAKGFGDVKWAVDSSTTSTLDANIQNLKLTDHASFDLVGTVKRTHLQIKLFGNELVDAFHGLWVTLHLNSIHWNLHSEDKNPNLKYRGLVTGDGELAAFSGEIPKLDKLKETSKSKDLSLVIQNLEVKTSFISEVKGSGTITVHANPVDLLDQSVHFPAIDVGLKLGIGKFGEVQSQAHFKNIQYQLYPLASWKGQLEWDLNKTSPIVDALMEQKSLSGLLGAVAKVDQLIIQMDCEVDKDYSWLRFNQIHSSGIWKAYGTLTNEIGGMRGLFEAKVFNLPIGIRIQPDKTDIRFLPSTEWYNKSQSELLRGVQ